MATIHKFQELEVWKSSKEMAIIAFKTFNRTNETFSKLLISQLIRSAISVPSNIAEGFERESRKEFINFLSIAKGSNGEFLTQIMIAKEVGLIGEDEFNQLSSISNKIGLMLRGLIKYLTECNYKGQKFKSTAEESPTDYYIEELEPDILNKIISAY